MKQLFKHLFIIIAILAGCCAEMTAQTISRQVIGTAGKESKTADILLFSNIGEISVTTHKNSSAILTEGFEQPDVFIPTAITTFSSSNDLFYLYPNPASSEVTILNRSNTTFKFAAHSITGESIMMEPQTSFDNSLVLNIGAWTAGVYFFEFIDIQTNHVIATYKLIKL
jgi:hypothetical protein